eukprot:9905528-Karenia_brevis.AAC.1
METVLSGLPADDPEFAEERSSLLTKIESHKLCLRESDSIGVRIDNARAALSRAKARKEEATQAMSLATQTLEAATAEVTKVQQELADLEANVGSEKEEDRPPTLDALEKQLTAAVENLRQMECVTPQVVADAHAQAFQLFERFKATVTAAEEWSH